MLLLRDLNGALEMLLRIQFVIHGAQREFATQTIQLSVEPAFFGLFGDRDPFGDGG